MANKVPPVIAAAPMMPPRFHLAHLLLGDLVSSLDASSFATAMAEHATINSMASCKEDIFYPRNT